MENTTELYRYIAYNPEKDRFVCKQCDVEFKYFDAICKQHNGKHLEEECA